MNGSFKKQALGSWFSVDLRTKSLTTQTNSQTTCCPSSMSLWHEIMDDVPRKTDANEKETTNKMKARKIRVYPDKEQKGNIASMDRNESMDVQ